MVDPKFLKLKATPKTMRRYEAPRHVNDYLVSRGINLSEVCRTALERALEAPRGPKAKDLASYTFRLDAELAERCSKAGVNISEVCRLAVEAIYSELKAETKKS